MALRKKEVNCLTWFRKRGYPEREGFLRIGVLQTLEETITENKLLQITTHLRKWIQLKAYGQPVKHVWISSLTLILIFWWFELVILRIHRKVYQNFIFNFGCIWKRKFVLYQNLFFFHTGKPVSSQVLVWRKLHTMADFICYTSLTL